MNKAVSGVTPMMAQFLEIKASYPDALLFYRMGDFYEMFFEDAVAAAEALDIALTKRGKHHGEDIPMCGVPVHSAESYFHTLIKRGFRVAVCEQLESPEEAKKRGSKSVVKRGVVRLVTPGTITEDSLLAAQHHNYLVAIADVRDEFAIAWADVSTGDFNVQPIALSAIAPKLAALGASELVLSEATTAKLGSVLEALDFSPTILSPSSFDSQSGETRLCDFYKVKSLDSFASFSRSEIGAMGALLDYLQLTQLDAIPRLLVPQKQSSDLFVQIDAATRRNLEITQNLSGGRNDTLLSSVNKTVTSGGGRLLERRLSQPSTHLDLLNSRLALVDFFIATDRTKPRELLRLVPDLERALTRLSLGRGGPRDIVAIRAAIEQGIELPKHFSANQPDELERLVKTLVVEQPLLTELTKAVSNDPPLLARDGGFVAEHYNSELDELRELKAEGRSVILRMQADLADQTGVGSLKIKHNNVLGYFIETPATHAKKMLSEDYSDLFIHRQTTANAVRFTTVELSQLETKILNANGRSIEIELEIFGQLVSKILDHSSWLSEFAKAISEIDLAISHAEIAEVGNWVRPSLTTDREFDIKAGRHPVVENALKRSGGEQFIPNDCDLSADIENARPVWLLTGPNMAGKSTYLRQNALIALLAQTGSYVPAQSAKIGLVSQIFSRVGASDDLARGRSTFMVEMVETAAILNQADDRALVILDEIGRGTATYDGLSIAWATLEHLHDVNQCRTLFATHYHELTALNSRLTGLMNATVRVSEFDGEIIFLHEVTKGAADRSYGVQVARLAGLPDVVISRARSILSELETGDVGSKTEKLIDDLPLFSAAPSAPPSASSSRSSGIEDALAEIFPDELSPRQALDALYKLKDLEAGD